MGTSRSGSVGSSTRWNVTRDDVEALTEAIVAGIPLSIPQDTLLEGAKKGGPASIRQSVEPNPSVPRTIRALGRRLVAAGSTDTRFRPELGDCAVKVALDILLGLFTAATLKHRTPRDTDNLLAEYAINGTRNVPKTLAKVLDQRFREDLIKKCRKSSDSADKARRAMQDTLIEILSPDGTPREFGKLNGSAIHAALRKINSMKITERFYSHLMDITLEFILSSLRANISHSKGQTVLKALRITYSDYVAKEIVKRAREKGLSAGQIPDKMDDWMDLLTEEEVHA